MLFGIIDRCLRFLDFHSPAVNSRLAPVNRFGGYLSSLIVLIHGWALFS
jgi:hypothetical protein